MHFSIPDTQELYPESSGTTYTGYNIYINGSYHCCLRYKQLHALHEQLRRRCLDMGIQLPVFPPKRLLPLTNGQLETRRAALEHYLQQVGQDVRVAKLDLFQNFLLNAQQETAAAERMLEDYEDIKREATLEVVLTNGYQLQVNCLIGDNTNALLRQACLAMQLPTHLMSFFCLFLMRKDASNGEDTLVLLRRLMDFESPYLSRLRARPCQILLRKSYWNPAYDFNLLHDATALNLLFIQTVSDVENDWIIAPPDVRQKLRALQNHNMKKEYLEMARLLPLYGCLQFSTALVDYPEPQTTALIAIGNRELSLRTVKGAKVYETKFRVTRMRCWRVTAIHNTLDTKDTPTNLQLSFEYLMSKQTLRWITIISSQAMLMSVCLQAMVDELLNCKDANQYYGNSIDCQTTTTTPGTTTNNGTTSSLAYLSRDGRIIRTTLSQSSSTPSFQSNEQMSTSTSTSASTTSASTTTSSSNTSSPSPTTAPVKFLSQRRTKTTNPKISNSHSYSAVFFRNAQDSVHNEAFEGIGDDDL